MIKLLNGRTENMSDKQILRFQKAIANAINVDVNTAFAMWTERMIVNGYSK